MIATPEMVQQLAGDGRKRRRQGLDDHSSLEVVDARHAGVSCWCVGNLEDYVLLAIEHGLCDASGTHFKVPCAIVNLKNKAKYEQFIATSRAQALLRSSVLYDLVQGRLLTAEELWLIQGFAHPAFESVGRARASSNFPVELGVRESFEDIVSVPHQKEMLGNSMHVSAMASWLLFALAIVDCSSFAPFGKTSSPSRGGGGQLV